MPLNDASGGDLLSTHSAIGCTARIVSAWVGSHAIPAAALPALIGSVHAAVTGLDAKVEPPRKLVPAVPISRSIQAAYIVCLEDGKKLKMLKRYLRSQHGLEPEEYRRRWGLPHDYPMVAPDYAARRSALAKATGLGKLTRRGR